MCECGQLSELKICKSRELRASILYITCDCIKRNGLQDDCRLKVCRGNPDCLTRPDPKCCPSTYARRFANMTMGVTRKPNADNRHADAGTQSDRYSCCRGECCESTGYISDCRCEPTVIKEPPKPYFVCFPCNPGGYNPCMPCGDSGDSFGSCDQFCDPHDPGECQVICNFC